MSLHRDAALIDRLGRALIIDHFACTDAIVRRWRRKGIPRMHEKTFQMLWERHQARTDDSL